ncbi:MAG: hypothetical protein JWM27_5061 [Gemmatimonadetes bacterium]|nr:hypothetical protein [Gemmatimonadota bacterium]
MPGKLKLQLDGLKVESFEADAQAYGSGTVRGAEMFGSIDGTCVDETCRNYGTCRVGAGGCLTVP